MLQPEVLSRCSTPLSPGGSMLANSIANIAISDLSHSLQTPSSVQLPFLETDTSAASKQEHVISVVSRTTSAAAAIGGNYPGCTRRNSVIFFFRTIRVLYSFIFSPQNLRELSMHLLKQSSMRTNKLRSRAVSEPNAMHVHAVATKYASSQLEISRSLCANLTLAAGVDVRLHQQIGFHLMYVMLILILYSCAVELY